jgi:hypothetical protein
MLCILIRVEGPVGYHLPKFELCTENGCLCLFGCYTKSRKPILTVLKGGSPMECQHGQVWFRALLTVFSECSHGLREG